MFSNSPSAFLMSPKEIPSISLSLSINEITKSMPEFMLSNKFVNASLTFVTTVCTSGSSYSLLASSPILMIRV